MSCDHLQDRDNAALLVSKTHLDDVTIFAYAVDD